MQIRDGVALVTGSNRGIGKALVEALLERGAGRVYASARRMSNAEPLVQVDRKRVVPLQLDITSAAEIARAAAEASDVRLLLNNAGVVDFGRVLGTTPESFQRIFCVNFFGTLQVIQAFAETLVKREGGVVNILSVAALAGMPVGGVYSASKAATWSLTQSLRADLGKRGVKVFGVFPGPVDTDMSRRVEMAKASPQSVAREVLAGVEADVEDIFPDPMSKQLYATWKADHKAIESQFAAMAM